MHQHATSLSGYTGMQSSIVLVSYTTESVLNFALPAYAINSAFAETHEHALRLFFPSDSEEFYHIDERWNKVKVAEIVLQENNVSAVMWIDADMIVFDFSFDVQQMLDRYSADLVISAERFTENGVVNTGCFIARNTDWTKRFLQLWWTVQDKASGMDQHVFDYIWRGNLLDVQQHVAILPHDILNTHFPATKNQKEHHQFLHLAGASSSYRQIVFEHGLAELCSSTRERRLMAHQLGLNRTFLLCVEMIVKEKLDLVRLQREIENHSTSVHDLEAVQKVVVSCVVNVIP